MSLRAVNCDASHDFLCVTAIVAIIMWCCQDRICRLVNRNDNFWRKDLDE